LIGNFNAPQINLEIQYWSDNEIDARVDRNIGGELDRDGIALVLAPANAPELKATGVSFHRRALGSRGAATLPAEFMVAELAGIAPLQLPGHARRHRDPVGRRGYDRLRRAREPKQRERQRGYLHVQQSCARLDTDSAQLDSYDISHCPGTVTYRKSISAIK